MFHQHRLCCKSAIGCFAAVQHSKGAMEACWSSRLSAGGGTGQEEDKKEVEQERGRTEWGRDEASGLTRYRKPKILPVAA